MRTAMTRVFLSVLIALPVVFQLGAATLPRVKPEEVGMSLERLQRIAQMLERRIAAGEMAGAVAIVARKGKVVHLTAKGVVDLETKQPVTAGTMFRVASMTKPVTSVAIMMMIEEGKIRLNDPVSRYIPEFRGQKVAVAAPAAPRGESAAPATGGRGETPASPAGAGGGRGGRGGRGGGGTPRLPIFTTPLRVIILHTLH